MNKQIEDQNHIQDAEWTEVTAQGSAAPTKKAPWTVFRAVKAFCTAVGVLVLVIFVIAILDPGPATEASTANGVTEPPTDTTASTIEDAEAALAEASAPLDAPLRDDYSAVGADGSGVVGTWIMATKGGEDGQSRCMDFDSRGIMLLNKEVGVGQVVKFGTDGRMLAIFRVKGIPGFNVMRTNWSLQDAVLSIPRHVIRNDTQGTRRNEDRLSDNIYFDGENVMIWGDARLVRCVGDIK